MNILFYITGHGFGHATRIIAVINSLYELAPESEFYISTWAPEELFRQNISAKFKYVLCRHDIGAVQKDLFHVDKLATLKGYADFIKQKKKFIREQVDFVKDNNIQIIVSDIPAVAFNVARKAGTPGIGIGNFSWDWIYAPYVEEYPEYHYLLEELKESYSQADLLLKLPFHGDMSTFPVVKDIPIITRKPVLPRKKVLETLKIKPDEKRKIILLSFGGLDYSNVLPEKTENYADYLFVSPIKVYDCNIPYAMYVLRDDFRECDVLVRGIKKYAHSYCIPREDFLKRNWKIHLDMFFTTKFNWPEIDINGAQTAAEEILSFPNSGKC
jgi:hypothetical protein